MSNGTNEPLPGLLDDPQFQIDLPWNDLPIAPLRNPAPQRNANAPSPLEPEAGASANPAPTRSGGGSERRGVGSRQNITPNDVLQARESRKPHLAISELVDDNEEPGSHSTQLPSFVSLSVVEKSPTQAPQPLSRPMQKRPRLEDEHPHDLGRQLPRPAQREQIVHRPAPLLPAMVTGLHEPPPSANLLPSMDADQRSGATRSAATSKIQVKDILMPTDTSRSPSPARQLPSLHSKPPHLPHLDFPPPRRASTEPTPPTTSTSTPVSATIPSTRDGSKPRRIRRKWTDDETRDLLAGVRKHGVGKWKQILTDPSYTFDERSAVDLKDRYRVCSKDELNGPAAAAAAAAAAVTSKSPANTDPSPNSPGSDHPASRGASPAPGSGPQKQRRKRRAWTTEEDDALLRGVSKHGFQWTVIHDDEALSLSHRRATDLRDRIRNKFPEGYRLAESKPLRSEIKRVEREREREREERDRAFASDDVQQAKGKEPASQPSAAAAAAGGGSGVTLPSLSLDDMDDMDMDADEGIRLPPLLPWDDMTN
ncbi:uncharacterized protein HMPREF1541_00754 [Cyphellophora europaea CBS 101466]|uniref:Myb-like domain-containing protein n=1 Tax=Cyphellophora europaea (strain CBS 101466) TaxID=1220924 RepID=W2SF88_CYPE1|nr:uncharacterized protein HMPREF1541_00754 [Cyphellophora europaea CBS 101466]ETN46569.1 hypothetical protein HMPREF1541_00754 [Cyphellophora europaea CBS 101466]